MFEIVLNMVSQFASIIPVVVTLVIIFNIIANLLWGGGN